MRYRVKVAMLTVLDAVSFWGRRQLLATCILLAGVWHPTFAANDYDRLILRARAGDTEPALIILRHKGSAASLAERFDHILIASWAGKPDEVIAVYENLPLDPVVPPANVLQAVARAFRALQRWPEALTVWRTGLHQYPAEQVTFAAGFTMTLVDAGQAEQAIQTGLDWVQRFPNNADLHLALAYAYALKSQPFDALYHSDKAFQLAPQAPWVQTEYVFALQRAGLSEQALEQARKYPAHFNAGQIRGLQADVAALKTRLASQPTRSEAERFDVADRALTMYDELMNSWQAQGPEAAADLVRLRIDRLNALHARVRMAELVQAYETLVAEGVTVPAWALTNVASAYLYERQPERARDLYRAVLADLEARTAPHERDHLGPAAARLGNNIGLLYALVEAEQFDELETVLESIRRYQPAWLYVKGNPSPLPNETYLGAKMALVAADMARDDTPAAQETMEHMVAQAPNNTELRTNLAGIYQARAQPRRAEEQLKLAETMVPRALDVEQGQGLVALDLQEWRQAEELSADTIARYPENQGARRLARLWDVHNMAELRISARRGLASDSPVSGSGDFGIDAVLYTTPLNYNWRGFAGLGYAEGSYSEGSGYYNWQRGGIEWRSRDWWVEGEVALNRYGYGGKLGLRLSAAYDLNDHWQIGTGLERLSRETPLRALRSDISSHTGQGYVRWRANERREWRLGFSGSRFSDGNRRWSLSLDGSERIYTHPHLKLDLLVGVSMQGSNRDANRPYFNPERGLMLLPAARATHILNRRYENVWEHFATFSAGVWRQRYYGASGVLGLTYGHRYRYNDVFEVGLSINGLNRSYDGVRERELQLLLDVNSRF